ncbi:MAG TPA: protein-methionine-sulfoxide reductase catalytic subunit MsrP [Anaerolineales bacterium]|nr:protein-methionine-sulfoxide reductase catalytic subunit MsrP [Anaerolineales bacterium]
MKIPSSQITPEAIVLNRREFLKLAGVTGAGAWMLAACGGGQTASQATQPAGIPNGNISATSDELGNPVNTFDQITNYNNYYEFSFEKESVAGLARDFVTSPWQIEIGGLVNKPGLYDIETLKRTLQPEERIYRLRCVEAWSMVIPWLGFPLSKLLTLVEPTSTAKYVRFQTLFDTARMPGQKNPGFAWPYTEGLRLDEAMHDLTILATGMYGKDLLPQNGAPIRLVVPWKYGFKSVKSIVKIDLVEEMPTSLWMSAAPNEYGFYANVNPTVDHPRWSQAYERRILASGGVERVPTLLFNGYQDSVASLYEGMDLARDF